MVVAGLLSSALASLLSVAFTLLANQLGELLLFASRIGSALSILGDGLILTGCVMLARLGRPGRSQTMVSAVFHGLSILFTVALIAGMPTGVVALGLVGLLASLLDVVAVIALALAIRELGKSRSRSFDAAAFTAIGGMVLTLAGWTFFVAKVDTSILFPLCSTVDAAARVTLVALIVVFLRQSYLPEPVLAHDTAFRGPTGEKR